MTADTTAPDPTAVMVRRVFAYYIDLVVYGLAALIPVMALSESRPLGEVFSSAEIDALDRYGRLDGVDPYFFKGNTLYSISESDLVTAGLIALGVFLLVSVVLQGLTGRTIGKFVTGIRTVRPDGTRPGILRAFGRTACWIIDVIPTVVMPLVGGILALVTNGHRRLGDLLARTYVVHRQFAGAPIVPEGDEPAADPEPDQAAAAPVVVMGDGADAGADPADAPAVTDDRAATETAWATDEAGGDTAGVDEAAVFAAADDDAPADTAASAATGAEGPDQATGDDAAAGPADDAATSAVARGEPTAPKWDPDRRAYISYDPRRGEWVQHDAETGEWGPITRA